MITEQLIKNGLIWKNIDGSWSRFCPQCKEIINHVGVSDRRMKDKCRKAHLKKCVCIKCRAENKRGIELKDAPEGVWKNNEGNWCRTCPKCNNIVIHKGVNKNKNKSQCIYAHHRQRQCKHCNAITKGKSGTWTKEEESLLVIEGGNKLLHELSDIFNKHSAKGIRSKRRRLGIVLSDNYISKAMEFNRSLVNPDNLCKLDQTWTIDDLTNDEYQVLIGCQLGDGSVKKCGSGKPDENGKCKQRNFIFYCCHVSPCCDYIDWKIKMLARFLPRKNIITPVNSNIRAELNTLSHPIFTKLRDKFYSLKYQCNKDIIPLDLIEKLDLFGLMIWYLDDGYLGVPQDGLINNARNPNGPKWHKKPSPHIVAKGYKYNDLVEVCKKFNSKFNLSLNVRTTKHRDGLNKQINIPAVDRSTVLGQWRELAKKHNLPECMYYKLNMHSQELLEYELKKR